MPNVDDLIQDSSTQISRGKGLRPDPHQPPLASDGVEDREDQIRARAHQLWEAEGQPADRADAHWLQAEQELASDYVLRTDAAPKAKARAKRSASK